MDHAGHLRVELGQGWPRKGAGVARGVRRGSRAGAKDGPFGVWGSAGAAGEGAQSYGTFAGKIAPSAWPRAVV